jgi:hypothetical protein
MPLHRADPDHRRPSWRKLNDFRCAHGAHSLIIKLLAI